MQREDSSPLHPKALLTLTHPTPLSGPAHAVYTISPMGLPINFTDPEKKSWSDITRVVFSFPLAFVFFSRLKQFNFKSIKWTSSKLKKNLAWDQAPL